MRKDGKKASKGGQMKKRAVTTGQQQYMVVTMSEALISNVKP